MYCFFKQSGKEFHAAAPVQEKARLPYVDSQHLGTVQTGMAVPCHADTCRPKCRV